MKDKHYPKKTDALLDDLDSKERDLAFVLQKVKHLSNINQIVLPLLDPSYRDMCQVANIEGDKLIIAVKTSAIATQLHFQTVELLNAFRKHPNLARIKHIKVKVSQSLPTRLNQKPNRKVETFTPATAALIEELSEGMEDPELQAIMKRIAKSGKE